LTLSASLEASVAALQAFAPELRPGSFLGLVLGSGLGDAALALDGARALPYQEIPGFPAPTVQGHGGQVVVGSLRGVPVVALQGRVHLYEGHPLPRVVHGVRTLVRLGARLTLLTNAAGGIRPELRIGDFMVIEDHINLTGHNPLTGPNADDLGPRFPDCSACWDGRAGLALRAAGATSGGPLAGGVYAGLLGPSYETPAEIRMLRTLGADAVGMSTVLEAIAIRHMGGRLCGLSLITNAAAGSQGPGQVLDHADVAQVARGAAHRLSTLLSAWLDDRRSWWGDA
jgi:purine-nucleoside phosphorylase